MSLITLLSDLRIHNSVTAQIEALNRAIERATVAIYGIPVITLLGILSIPVSA
jgi:hypothetical protein